MHYCWWPQKCKFKVVNDTRNATNFFVVFIRHCKSNTLWRWWSVLDNLCFLFSSKQTQSRWHLFFVISINLRGHYSSQHWHYVDYDINYNTRQILFIYIINDVTYDDYWISLTKIITLKMCEFCMSIMELDYKIQQ